MLSNSFNYNVAIEQSTHSKFEVALRSLFKSAKESNEGNQVFIFKNKKTKKDNFQLFFKFIIR